MDFESRKINNVELSDYFQHKVIFLPNKHKSQQSLQNLSNCSRILLDMTLFLGSPNSVDSVKINQVLLLHLRKEIEFGFQFL